MSFPTPRMMDWGLEEMIRHAAKLVEAAAVTSSYLSSQRKNARHRKRGMCQATHLASVN